MVIIWCKFEQNRLGRSGFIMKWNIWPLILAFDLRVKVTKFCFFTFAIYGYYTVQFWAKSIEPFKIYCKMKYLTFDCDLWHWGESHTILFFYLTLYDYYIVQILAKSTTPFRSYCKMKYLTFDFGLWPWGQSHEKTNSPTLFICIYG